MPRAFLVISICCEIVLKAQFFLNLKKAGGRFNFTVWQKSSVHFNIDFLKRPFLTAVLHCGSRIVLNDIQLKTRMMKNWNKRIHFSSAPLIEKPQYDRVSDVVECEVLFASKIMTPLRMHLIKLLQDSSLRSLRCTAFRICNMYDTMGSKMDSLAGKLDFLKKIPLKSPFLGDKK